MDDDADTVVSLATLLRCEGYDAKGIADPTIAIEEIELFAPDAVVVDIAMPKLSGWELAREVRQRHGKKPILIAITGAYTKAPDEILSRVAGFNHFLKKPCDPNFLLNILGALAPGK